MLEHFYAEVNNKKGDDYEPGSLKVMMASLDRHLMRGHHDYKDLFSESQKMPKTGTLWH